MKFTPGLLPIDRNRREPLKLAPSDYVPPDWLDRRPELLKSSDQGRTPECTRFGLQGFLEYHRYKMGDMRQVDDPCIYRRAKEIDGHPNEDGTTLEDILQAAQDLGYLKVANVKSISAADMKQALHRYGVVLSAYMVTEGWRHAQPDGWIDGTGAVLGGHCVLACGYDFNEKKPDEEWYIVQNSWSERQGWRGFNRLSPEVHFAHFRYGLVWDMVG